jgi:hypothetical protein
VRLAFDMRQEGSEIVGIDLSGDPAIGEWYEQCECLNACCAPQPHRSDRHLLGHRSINTLQVVMSGLLHLSSLLCA